MHKILIISNDFPPPIKGGNMRVYKFVKYLIKNGFDVYVICNNWDIESEIKKNPKLNYDLIGVKFFSFPSYGRKKNKTLKITNENKIEKKETIIRLFKKYVFNLLQPDLYKYTWNYKALKEAINVISDNNITHLLTTSPPHSTQLIGLKLKKHFKDKINWIADFRDLWSLSHSYPIGFSLIKLYNKYLEELVLKNANKIIFVSNGIKDLTLRTYSVNNLTQRSCVISNGYDNDDFLNLKVNDLVNTKFINLSYIGTMFGPQANHKLFEGIISYCEENCTNNNIKFNFIGEFENRLLKLIESNNYFNFVSKKNHKDALDIMYSSQILILVLPNDFEGKIAYSGKFFEYIKIGKPILAIVPEGEVSFLISKYNLGEIANPDNILDIKTKIKKMVSQLNSYSILPVELLNEFSRESLAKQLIKIINEAEQT